MAADGWTALAETTGRLPGLALNLAQLQQQGQQMRALEANSRTRLALEGKRFEMEKTTADIENATANLALEQAKKQKAEYDRPVDIKTNPLFLSLPDAQKPEVLKFFADNKYTDPNGVGKVGDIMQGVKTIESSKTLFQNFMAPVVQAKQANVIAAWGEFQQAQAAGDPKKVQAAKAKFDQLNGDYHQSMGKFDEHIKNLTDQEQAVKLKQMEIDATREKKGEKSGQNWILSNRSTVISYDGGKTYVTSDGRSKAMPVNAVKVPGGATLEEIRMNEAKQDAQAELEGGQSGAGRAPKQAALSGTGPYKRVASAFEAVAGGLGLDVLVGQQGFFPDMADAKQYLRSVKQMGKAALMNSSRGAIWEQQRIDELFPDPDKTFTNPRIEARKFGNLRDILTSEKTYNNQAITQAISPKEVEKYRASNNEIDRLMALISEPPISGVSSEDRSLIDKYLKRGK